LTIALRGLRRGFDDAALDCRENRIGRPTAPPAPARRIVKICKP
jgi:hypothetical protein